MDHEDKSGDSRGSFLPTLSVKRPVAVGVIFSALLVLGALAYLRIPIQLVPSGYELPFLYVGIPTLPSNPKDLEEKVAVPTEDMLSTVRHVEQLRTRVGESQTSFMMNFEDGTDMVEAYNEVQDRLERVRPSLPEDVERTFIWKYDPNDSPIFWFGVSLDGASERRAEEYFQLLTDRVVRPIERLDGVSRVEMWGARKKLVFIEIDNDLTNAAGLATYELIQQMRRSHFSTSAGYLETGRGRDAVRVMARFEDLEELRQMPVGNGYRLEDVASVRLDFEDSDSINRINGKDAVLFDIFKEADANTIDVTNSITKLLHEQMENDPELKNFEFHEFQNQGELILESINNLKQTAVFGGAFAFVILLVFLRRMRLTLMVMIAIPVSLLVTLIVMYFTGFTLNLLTMMGLMLSVGMVVDNSIVVVENIQRLRQAGESPRQAAIHGTAEVALALVVATSTTVVVFLPMILMSGSESLSFYLGKIGYPVCISLVASLFVSLIFVPVTSLYLGGRTNKKDAPSWGMMGLENLYRFVLRWVLSHRLDTAFLVLAISATVAIPFARLKKTDELETRLNDVQIRFDVPASMSFDEIDGHLREVEATVEAMKGEMGIESYLSRTNGRRHRLEVFLGEDENGEVVDREKVVAALKEKLPTRPGVKNQIGWSHKSRGGGASDSSVTLKLSGPDSKRLAELSEEVVRRIELIPEVVSVEADLEEDLIDELHLELDRGVAQRHGLSAALVGGVVDYSLRGRRLGEIELGGRDFEMRAVGAKAASKSLSELLSVRVSGSDAGSQLGRLTSARIEKGFGSIHRENRTTVLDIKVNTHQEDLEALSTTIDGVLDGLELPRGYELGKGDRFRQMKESEGDQQFALILAIVFVFLLMGGLFESALVPVSIVFSIPFAFLGVYWALYLTDTALDIMAGVGLVILVGVVVNNAIVLVDTITQLRSSMPLAEAVVEGATRRLRPVLMTALTTIFGLIPMAIGGAGIVGIPYAPLGRTVIGGLVASTLLTLVVVPYFYLLLELAKSSAGGGLRRRLLPRLTRRSQVSVPPPSEGVQPS